MPTTYVLTGKQENYILLTLCIQELNKYLTNSVDPDEIQHTAASHQGLHCLLK